MEVARTEALRLPGLQGSQFWTLEEVLWTFRVQCVVVCSFRVGFMVRGSSWLLSCFTAVWASQTPEPAEAKP